MAVAAAFAVAAVAAGVVLRLWNLRDQVLGGDELHAVRAALAQPLPALLTTYQLADSCIPLTALDRLLLDHGVALDEWRLRLPVLACGFAALLVLPALARRHLTAAGWALYSALVAVAPLLILYSRIARSYMPATLLAFVAVMAFERWWAPPGGAAAVAGSGPAAPSWQPAMVYVGSAALAVWFHLGMAPMVVAPLLFAAAELALTGGAGRGSGLSSDRRDRQGDDSGRRGDDSGQHGDDSGQHGDDSDRRGDDSDQHEGDSDRNGSPPGGRLSWARWRRLAVVAAGLALTCTLFLAPAAPSLARLIAAKHQPQIVPAATWWGVLRLQAGSGQRWPVALFWLAALAGAATLLRRRPRLGCYLLALVAAQLAGIVLLSPLGLARVQVLDRYLLPALPIVLLWVAVGLSYPWWPRQSPWGRRGQLVGAAGVVLVWLCAGPFADPAFRASSFMHHNDLVAFALPRAEVPPDGLPLPYRALGGPPGSAVVELPWPPVWDFGRSFYAYQEIHGMRVLVAAPGGALPQRRLRFRNQVSAEPAALLASGARYVAVHRHLGEEEGRLLPPAGPIPPRRMPPALAGELAAAAGRIAASLTAAWGPPTFSDRDVAVWWLRPGRRRPASISRSTGRP
jgi:hypothetical protein